MLDNRVSNIEVNAGADASGNLSRDVLTIRSNICNAFLIVAAVIAIPVLSASLLRITQLGWQPVMLFHIAVVFSVFVLVFLRNKTPYAFKAGFIIAMLFFLGVIGIIQFGMISGGSVFIVAAAPMATLFFGGRTGLVVLLVSITSTVIIAYLVVSGQIVHDFNLETYVLSSLSWTGKIMAWFLVSLGISVSIHVFNGKLIHSLKLSEQRKKELELHQANLEKIVEERTAELRNSNQNLERFARIAAHDMKSPLNAIATHAQMLDIDSEDSLDPELKEHIKNILDSTYLVSAMISDLLDYSRLNKDTDVASIIDMNRVFEKTERQLIAEITEAGVSITHDELPVVEAVEVQIIRVLQNILANAIKYRDKDKISSIHISSDRNKNEWVFSVQDNGIGIPVAHTETIFEMFHQVDKDGKYEGSGIGLASCKKIIERHGGKIWVESKQNEGSTFFFTLKATD